MIEVVAVRDSVSRFVKKCWILKCGKIGEVVFKDVALKESGEMKMYVYCIDHAIEFIENLISKKANAKFEVYIYVGVDADKKRRLLDLLSV